MYVYADRYWSYLTDIIKVLKPDLKRRIRGRHFSGLTINLFSSGGTGILPVAYQMQARCLPHKKSNLLWNRHLACC
jgi:hypothetical protein